MEPSTRNHLIPMLMLALIAFGTGVAYGERGAIAGQNSTKEGKKANVKSWGTKDGIPPEIMSARNVAKRKKRFTIAFFRVSDLDMRNMSGEKRHREERKARDLAKRWKQYLAENAQNKATADNMSIRAGSMISGLRNDSLDALMDSIHMKILKRKIYFRHAKIERIQEYKYCTYPRGPLFILISPTGEDVEKFYYFRDSLDYYNIITRAMYKWTHEQFMSGNIENAYNGIQSLNAVGEAFDEKDALLNLTKQIETKYAELKGKPGTPKSGKKPTGTADKKDTTATGDSAKNASADSPAPAGASTPDNSTTTVGGASQAELVDKASEPDMNYSIDPNDPMWRKAKAIYKNAMLLEANAANDLALKYYRKIVNEYPHSPQAKLASEAIQRLE